GVKPRKREVTQIALHGGKTCEEVHQDTTDGTTAGLVYSLEHNAVCETDPCPVDCQVSEWTVTKTCSVICNENIDSNGDSGGFLVKERTVQQEAANGGQACPKLSETIENCNNDKGCPKECELTDWQDDGNGCSADCVPVDLETGVPLDMTFQGERRKVRAILNEAKYGGTECSSFELEKTIPGCQPPLNFCPVDCVLAEWAIGSDASCSVACGGSGEITEKREILRHPRNGGNQCATPQTRPAACPAQHECPVDCVLSEWNSWEPCTKT
ncbi:unnamed protein product, partial [Amoebophrya sp. A120]